MYTLTMMLQAGTRQLTKSILLAAIPISRYRSVLEPRPVINNQLSIAIAVVFRGDVLYTVCSTLYTKSSMARIPKLKTSMSSRCSQEIELHHEANQIGHLPSILVTALMISFTSPLLSSFTATRSTAVSAMLHQGQCQCNVTCDRKYTRPVPRTKVTLCLDGFYEDGFQVNDTMQAPTSLQRRQFKLQRHLTHARLADCTCIAFN